MQTANIFSFHGGIHPAENKAQSLQLPLGRPNLPSELILPLGQHIGQSSRPLVAIGDHVLKGETIAINNGFLSSFLHAPTSGSITAIEERLIAHPSGLSDLCIILSPDGKEEWTALEPLIQWQTNSKTDVLAYLAKMGIVGMGGAGFPTQVKLQGAHKNPLTHFIINAAECEPYITADDMLIREKTLELILGIEILQHLVEADQVVIGIEDNKPTAISALKSLLEERNSDIQLAVVPTKYPSGGEKQLIQLLTGEEVPSGQYPADIGVLCQNVGTCVAVHDSVYLGKPLISRFTTLTGDALKAPQNVEVLLGTPVAHLLDYAESKQDKLHRLVMGGPMMGYTLDSAAVPIVKTSNCILAATKKELPAPAPEQACIRCGMCEQACPASLLPQQLLWFSKSQEHEKAEHHNLFDCIECGACSYVCPSSIPLVQYYRHSKSSIREARESNVKADLAKQRFEARKARQDAETAEKEAKRLARQKATSSKPTGEKKAAPTKVVPATAPISDDTKKLKVDVAIGKSKLKKLQKQLLEAQESEHLEEVNTLQLQFTEQEKILVSLEEQLAKTAAPIAAPATTTEKTPLSDELKKAKIDAAMAKAAIKKVEKALKKAEEINAPEIDAIRQQLKEAQQRADELEKALANPASAAPKAEKATPLSSSNIDADAAKKRKIDLAIAKAGIKKAEKNIALLKEQGKDETEISASEWPQKLIVAQEKLTKLESENIPSDADSNDSNVEKKSTQISTAESDLAVKVKKQKIAAALAKAQINKLTKRLENTPEDADSIQQEIAATRQKQHDAEALLAQLTHSQDNTQENR
ncbi:electron transport complex subunit RsxC [Marinomonas primoryensis]|uniref:Ion-translocating oxidoreductase complex subunit C n=1 Tax=Marinomonas primoryensis TaxID=178399 RepID=A0A859D354_9GAMM|nr:electron transport complex subunit RsxC [Marinomonas primoryensis]QKK81229.1 Electron transport complex protein RnfC [Marinomonas primoryensis]